MNTVKTNLESRLKTFCVTEDELNCVVYQNR